VSTERPRRTQQERSAETRQRILDAAVGCLFERGYAGTTTTEVAKRAGVSRGAQLHHFPTRTSLVVTTVEHLVEKRLAEYRAAVEALPEADRRAASIDLGWKLVSGETFYAWVELVVAARTDPELLPHVRELNARLGQAIHENFRTLFPELAQNPQFAVVPDVSLAVLEGLALREIARPETDCDKVEQVLETLKLLGRLLDVIQPFIPTE